MKKIITILMIFSLCIIIKGQKADVLLPALRVREQVIHHTGFSLSYNSSYVQPSWVAYKVTTSQVNREEVKGKYKPDPEVTTRSADKKDYKQGGYIMAQFVNYFDVQKIPGAVEETFYMTNITPMKLAYYNHIWLKIEELVRLWTSNTDGLYVVCGAILTDAPFTTIGDNHVSLPNRYYKAVYDPKNQKAIGFIFKNGMSSGKLNSYALSIDEIEEKAEIDLFPTLDDELEEKIESNSDFSNWNFELIE
jgi:endonuclease G